MDAQQNTGESGIRNNEGKSELFKQLVSYGIIGCISSGTDAILFAYLVYVLMAPELAVNIFTVCVGITISFFLNRKFTFKMKDHTAKRYIRFFTVGMFGLLLSELIIWAGSMLNVETIVIKLVSIVIVAVFQFVLNKTVSFRSMD